MKLVKQPSPRHFEDPNRGMPSKPQLFIEGNPGLLARHADATSRLPAATSSTIPGGVAHGEDDRLDSIGRDARRCGELRSAAGR